MLRCYRVLVSSLLASIVQSQWLKEDIPLEEMDQYDEDTDEDGVYAEDSLVEEEEEDEEEDMEDEEEIDDSLVEDSEDEQEDEEEFEDEQDDEEEFEDSLVEESEDEHEDEDEFEDEQDLEEETEDSLVEDSEESEDEPETDGDGDADDAGEDGGDEEEPKPDVDSETDDADDDAQGGDADENADEDADARSPTMLEGTDEVLAVTGEFKFGADMPFVQKPTDQATVFAHAKEQGKPAMVLATKSWCPHCADLANSMNADPAMKTLLSKFVAFHAPDDAGEAWHGEVPYVPRAFFYNKDGQQIDIHSPYQQYPYFFDSSQVLQAGMQQALSSA